MLSESFHVTIADFDSAYEIAHDQGAPKREDYRYEVYYMPTKISKRICNTFEADIWVVTAVKACIAVVGC